MTNRYRLPSKPALADQLNYKHIIQSLIKAHAALTIFPVSQCAQMLNPLTAHSSRISVTAARQHAWMSAQKCVNWRFSDFHHTRKTVIDGADPFPNMGET